MQLLAEKLPAGDADLNVRPRGALGPASDSYLWAHSLSQETVAAILATLFSFVELPRAQLEAQLQRSPSTRSSGRQKREQPTEAATAAIRCARYLLVVHY